MTVYVQKLNLASSERYEREMKMKVREAWLSANFKGAEETPEQSKEQPEPDKMKAPDDTTTSMNISPPRSVPLPRTLCVPSTVSLLAMTSASSETPCLALSDLTDHMDSFLLASQRLTRSG